MEMFDENHQYISLANKYRPQKFEDMVGQESISKTLQNELNNRKKENICLMQTVLKEKEVFVACNLLMAYDVI